MIEEKPMAAPTFRLLNFHSKLLEDIFKEQEWTKNMQELERTKNL